MFKMLRKYFIKYKFNDLFIKNLRSLLVVILIPIIGMMILGIFVYRYMMNAEIKTYCDSVAIRALAQTDNIIQESKAEMVYVGYNSGVELFMNDKEMKQEFYSLHFIREMLLMPVIIKNYVDDIYLYSENNDYIITSSLVYRMEEFNEQVIKDLILNKMEHSNTLKLVCIDEDGKNSIIIYCDVIFNKNARGVIAIKLNPQSIMEELDIPKEIEIGVRTEDDILLMADTLSEEMVIEKLTAMKTDTYCVIENGYCIYAKKDDRTGMEILLRLDLGRYETNLSRTLILLVFILVIVIWSTVIIALYVSIMLYRPIEKIMDSLQNYGSGLVEEQDIFLGKDELEYILRNIQRNASTKKRLEIELEERVTLLKKAQSIALQFQINPHFINNTLENINWIALRELKRGNQISKMIQNLSFMLRMALETSDVIVTVDNEIQHCKCYLDILESRYDDKIDVKWEIPSNVRKYKMIKILLQPLVENAISHGLKQINQQGKIFIKVEEDNGKIYLSVSDNGIGMSSDDLEKLRNILSSNDIKESRHIGLANVNLRIRLYYGDEYGVTVDSIEGKGFVAEICIPVIN